MEAAQVELTGTLHADGSLTLDGKPDLPIGRVRIVVQTLEPQFPENHPFWQMMQRIWAGQKARGHVPRSTEEVEAERRQIRDEWEARQQAIEKLQDECRQSREEQR